jgi:periplasmic mercuric ion binding protein
MNVSFLTKSPQIHCMLTFKTIKVSILFLFLSTELMAQQNENIKVWGNCGMCKKVIETAALKAGASKANWSEETHLLQVSYKSKKTSNAKIQEAIAAAGYDTEAYTAPNEVYSKLHGCCQYDRKSAVQVPAKDPAKQ